MSKRHCQNRSGINPQELLNALNRAGFQWTGEHRSGEVPPMNPMGNPMPPMGNPMPPQAPQGGMGGLQNGLQALAGMLNGQGGAPPMGPQGGMPPLPTQNAMPGGGGGGMSPFPPMMGMTQMRNGSNPTGQRKEEKDNDEVKDLLKEIIALLKGTEGDAEKE